MEWVNELAAGPGPGTTTSCSWYIRPLFLLPFCFFAYRRSLLGIGTHRGCPGDQHGVVPAAGEPEPGGRRDAGRGAKLPVRAVGRRQGVRLVAVPAAFTALARDLLAPVAGLGVGGDQRCGVFVEDRLDVRGQRHRRRERAHLLPAVAGPIMVDALIVIVARRLVRRGRGEAGMSGVGMLGSRFPYLRFGTGPEPLVMLPGLPSTTSPHRSATPASTPGRCAAWPLGARSPCCGGPT